MIVLVTFNAHYGSVLLNRKFKNSSKIRPVPRELSSSCADCVIFPDLKNIDDIIDSIDKEYAERIYVKEGNEYKMMIDFKAIES